jgi:hypothetical protein
MRTEDFNHWLSQVPDLTLAQRQQGVELLRQEPPLERVAAITDLQLELPALSSHALRTVGASAWAAA